MTTRTRKILLALASPLLCCGVLYGIISESRAYMKAEDFEPYHKHAKLAIESIPMMISTWSGREAENEIPRQAQVLLKPNKLFNRVYTDTSASSLFGNQKRQVSLLIVQCKQSQDMLGHYPKNCYPAQGCELVYNEPCDWQVAGFTIPGREYRFVIIRNGQPERTTVYNFMVIPNKGIFRDMEAVGESAADYQQRYYGAAQFQVVFHGLANADQEKEDRDAIFRTLMEPVVPVIKALKNGAIK